MTGHAPTPMPAIPTSHGDAPRHSALRPRTATRRAALTALVAGVVAVPLGASPALADPKGRNDLRDRSGRGAQKQTAYAADSAAEGPLAPPTGPFAPEVPAGMDADVRLAGYRQNSADPDDYGNYSLAQRTPADVTSIIVHDTEVDYDGTLRIFQNPASYASIHYVIREDGHVTQMVRGQDIAWHAGNWTFNQSSIGIELIGVAEDPSHYTDAQYEATGRLIRHLAQLWDIPLDRDHVLAHEDLPGTSAARQAAMHWDPGAYYDWEKLQRAAGMETPQGSPRRLKGTATIAPHYATNTLEFTSCNAGSPRLPSRPTSALMVRTAPRADAPLLVDPALKAAPGATGGTDYVCDWGDQVSYGQTFAIADERPGWVGLWISGQIGWVARTDAHGRQTVDRGPKGTRLVTPRGASVQAFGAAYPGAPAFAEAGLDAPASAPLPYPIAAGQTYVVEAEHRGEYYWSPRFDGTGGRWVRDDSRWLRIQLNHRSAFVRAEDVRDA